MKIFCVGRNYVAHAQELGNEVPDDPVIFLKPKSALVKPNLPFYYPEFTNDLQYEAELVLRISKNGRYIEKRKAHYFYDAITVGIDFTARDVQTFLKSKGLPWEKAKAFDGSTVIGDWQGLDSFPDKRDINFALYKNQQQVQKGNSSHMIFSFDTIVSHISKYFSINIGDVVFTGTPQGVGEVLPQDNLTGFLNNMPVFSVTIE